ncbi:hypothetical protein [Antarctobacter heliothermus]|uniref:SnoaL-like domain-containing protein n=1 Tax=Antarctobacter heliothermus TaxID=74033 RepID=A0A239FLN9_9RHOB|nr:hypothetical protein [Antarctobacter heliothermus]SNS57846.1 hypothetical protein SAMN04488078_102115 [Antarctobacter heliothermus]
MDGTRPIHDGLSPEQIKAASVPEAVTIYQDTIDAIKKHFWVGNWDALVSCIAVPNRISALDTARVFETHEEWLNVTRAARTCFADQGVTEYHRICSGAFFMDATKQEITGFHETYILRGSALAAPRFKGYMRLVLRDGRWQSQGLHTEQRDSVFPTIYADRLVAAKDQRITP